LGCFGESLLPEWLEGRMTFGGGVFPGETKGGGSFDGIVKAGMSLWNKRCLSESLLRECFFDGTAL
jgi:hypothetical protein